MIYEFMPTQSYNGYDKPWAGGAGINILKSKKHKNKTFYACDKSGSDPDCQFISWDPPVKDKKCPTCGSFMVYKKFRGKSYQKCGNRDCPSNEKRKKS